MRRLRTGGCVIALLGLLGLATACASAPVSPAVTGARDAATAVAATTAPGGEAAAIKAAAVAKEHGAVLPAKSGSVKYADLLDGVSCVGAQCVAVGTWYYGTASSHALLEVWNGREWSLVPAPGGPKYSGLAAVSCVATAATAATASTATAAAGSGIQCLALGSPTLAGSGSHWRVITAPSDSVTAVSCTSADACMAVGSGTGTAVVFATWNGRAWHAGKMHAPPSQAERATISGLSCVSADDCVAVGDYAYGITAQPSPALRDKTLAERWNGHSWSLLPDTVDVSHVDGFIAVSCPSADDCTAVGFNQGQDLLAEQWNGKTWRVEPMPTVSSIGYVTLGGVSCPAAGFCVAAGTYQDQAIAQIWNGKAWRITQLPEPPGGSLYTEVTSVSCASKTSCVAGGDTVPADTFAEVYAAGKWRLSATRNPT